MAPPESAFVAPAIDFVPVLELAPELGLHTAKKVRKATPRHRLRLNFIIATVARGSHHPRTIIKRIFISMLCVAVFSSAVLAAESEDGFVSIFDGKSFDGWKPATEHSKTWKIEDGALVARGERCHLFY